MTDQMMRRAFMVLFVAFVSAVVSLAANSKAKDSTNKPNVSSSKDKSVLSVKPRPLLALQVGHSSPITCFAFSPQGNTFATGSEDSTAILWDTATWKPIATLFGHTDEVKALAFSPDGKMLASVSIDGTVRLWNTTGNLRKIVLHCRIGSFEDSLEPLDLPTFMAFSPDGRTIATRYGKSVRLWDTESGNVVIDLRTDAVGSFVFSPDGNTVATCWRGEVSLWDPRTSQLKRTLGTRVRDYVASVTFSPDSSTVPIATETSGVTLWNAKSGLLKAKLPEAAWPISYSPDGRTLATNSSMEAGRLWDASTGQLKAVLQGNYQVTSFMFSCDSNSLAMTATDVGAGMQENPCVLIWDSRTGRLNATLQDSQQPAKPVSALYMAFSPDNVALAVGDLNNATIWDTSLHQVKARLLVNFTGQDLSIAPDGMTLATGWASSHIWHIPSGRLKGTLSGRPRAFSPDGRILATSDRSKTWLWDVGSGQLRAEIPDAAPQLVFSPDGKTVATASGTLVIRQRVIGGDASPNPVTRLWDVSTGQLKHALTGTEGGVFGLLFSPDGRTLITGCGQYDRSGAAQAWDVESGELKATLKGHKGMVGALAFDRDGTTLATASPGEADDPVRLWDVKSWQLKRSLHSKLTFSPTTFAFSPDGRLIAMGSYETAQLWDVNTGEVEATLGGHVGYIKMLAFSVDGRTLASQDYSGFVYLWDVERARRIPLSDLSQLSVFPSCIARPFSVAGAAASLRDPRDGRVLATLLALPANPVRSDGPVVEDDLFLIMPEGYFDCSVNTVRSIEWNINGKLYSAERYIKRFRRPDLVGKALRGERITAPAIAGDDVPPSIRFIKPLRGETVQGDFASVVVEARDDRAVKEVEIFVNGRPIPPHQARPLTAESRPIPTESKDVDPNHRITKQFVFRVELPQGAEQVELRAVAYDDTDLGSDAAVISIRRIGAKPITGKLFVLSVGVGRYQHSDGTRLKNLRFPPDDARAIAERFQMEGKQTTQSLYDDVDVRTLIDNRASASNIRAELKRIQQALRPGLVDTVIVYLSGHGISVDGRYFFATHEIDLKNISGTCLSGKELKESLAQLRARNVFLFVDTCHSGGLSGRSDDLAIEVKDSGAYILASSGPTEYSFESPEWKHGAFTKSLLQSLDNKSLEDDGAIRFGDLAPAVAREVRGLLRAAQRNETEQQVRIQATGPILEPIARAVR